MGHLEYNSHINTNEDAKKSSKIVDRNFLSNFESSSNESFSTVFIIVFKSQLNNAAKLVV